MKRWYLFPFSVLYSIGIRTRNAMYSLGFFTSTRFRTPIICVGNLSVGGSGKSPMVMYLAQMLSKIGRTGVLSRGYGRFTKGYGVVNYESTYKTVGDEAMQLFERFKNRFVIGVSEKRVPGAKKLIEDMDLDFLILDDAMQHRAIKAGFTIMMTEYSNPYFNDYLLPAGDLREPRSSAKRADIIVVSKCPPQLTDEQKKLYISKINPLSHQYIFFSSIEYKDQIINLDNRKNLPDNNLRYYDILLITGIANPKPLEEHLKKFNPKYKHLVYKDHHHFTEKDIKKIITEYKKMGEYKMILTTEKDFVRLKLYESLKEHLYYWPIEMRIDQQDKFNQIIIDYVQKVS